MLLPRTCSQLCLLLFFLFSVLGSLLLLGLQLVCPQPSTEHRKVSHGLSEAFLFCQGPGVILVIHALSFILFEGESLLILRGNTIYRMFTPPKSLTLKMKPVPRVSL